MLLLWNATWRSKWAFVECKQWLKAHAIVNTKWWRSIEFLWEGTNKLLIINLSNFLLCDFMFPHLRTKSCLRNNRSPFNNARQPSFNISTLMKFELELKIDENFLPKWIRYDLSERRKHHPLSIIYFVLQVFFVLRFFLSRSQLTASETKKHSWVKQDEE